MTAVLCALLCLAAAQDEGYRPDVKPASEEGQQALQRFVLPRDLRAELWAAEPLLANPVAFCFDDRGAVYVAETFRLHKGVTDNRSHKDGWVDDDLACRTVADRVAMYERRLREQLPELTAEHERIRRLVDSDGDGVADTGTVFAQGFRALADGIGAGLLAHDGAVWFTCIPKLWRLRDVDADGVADRREALYDGFGVHTALLGHDLHGLCLGPDGRVYFSIGDRGLHVAVPGGTLDLPDEGSVLRCELDGSGLEVFYRGLRNPQELAFDEFGNLFTGDNNSDGGDKARVVFLLDGGDSGWRIGFQSLSDRGPWNRERLWWPPFRDQAAFLLPPVANYLSGPSGLCYEPGQSALPERFRGHFLLCDFRGSSSHSGVYAFRLQAKGAGFEMVDDGPLIERVLPTDVDFAPDGSVFVTDWTEGWNQTGKGRIYRLVPAGGVPEAARAVAALLREGFRARSEGELLALLGHADQRVRLRAQLELGRRSPAPLAALAELASDETAPRLARLHAIWATGHIARATGTPAAVAALLPLRKDADHEVRAQLARVIGDARCAEGARALRGLLRDRSTRVRALAAVAVGRLAATAALDDVVTALVEADDRDPWLRHAGAFALHGCGTGDPAAVRALLANEHASVRLAACVALRRLADPALADLLADADPAVVREAARAIWDHPVPAAMPALAAWLERGRDSADEPTVRRALAANDRVADAAAAARVAAYAAAGSAMPAMRELALELLRDWAEERGRDRVLDLWRPRAPGSAADAADALRPFAAGLLAESAADGVRARAAETVGRLGLVECVPQLAALVEDEGAGGGSRVAALRALEQLGADGLERAVARAARSQDAAVRKAGVRVSSRLAPDAAVAVLDRIVAEAPDDEAQNALQALGRMAHGAADASVARWLQALADGRLRPALQLDLLEAAEQRAEGSPALAEPLRRASAAASPGDPLAPWAVCLEGGDADAGRKLFRTHEAAVCTRCHSLGDDGGDAGPRLDGVGSRLTRRQILESLVLPQARVADGFATVVLTGVDGEVWTGVLKREADGVIELLDADNRVQRIPAARVADRSPPVSAMPPMASILGRRELRDVVAFLAAQRQDKDGEAATGRDGRRP